MVVDDYADSRASLREALEGDGYEVIEASNGEEALAKLLTSPAPRVRLIVLDLQMPVMDGWRFLSLVGGYLRLSNIPVVVVSAYHPRPDPQKYKGVVGYLRAPYKMEVLLALVANGGVAPGTQQNAS